MGRQMRLQSQQHQHKELAHADVDAAAALEWLHAANASTMIHGHTHKPADHALATNLKRIVLTDWDLAATPARAEVLRLSNDSLKRYPLH